MTSNNRQIKKFGGFSFTIKTKKTMDRIKSLPQINTKTEEGKLLFAALILLTDRNTAPDEMLAKLKQVAAENGGWEDLKPQSREAGAYQWIGNDVDDFFVVHVDGATSTTLCNTDTAEKADLITKAVNYFSANNYGESDPLGRRKVAIVQNIAQGRNAGKWRFTLKAGNGEIVAQSHPQTYTRKDSALETLKNCFPDFDVEVKEGE